MTETRLRERISDAAHAAMTLHCVVEGDCPAQALPDLRALIHWVLKRWDRGDADVCRVLRERDTDEHIAYLRAARDHADALIGVFATAPAIASE